MTDLLPPADTTAPPRPRGLRARLPFALYLMLTLGLLVFLLWPAERGPAHDPSASRAAGPPPVSLEQDGQIRIEPASALHRKLAVVTIAPERITVPVLTVTGTVVASLRSERGGPRDWQFNTPDLLSVYTDWQKATAEIAFAATQLDSIRQLTSTRVSAQEAAVQRLGRLVEAGTDTERDLAAARTDLLQSQIEGRQQVHEAETSLRVAQRAEGALSRQLQQAGIDSELLRSTSGEMDIVVAEVPEAMQARVKRGQGCEARFLGVAERRFMGSVRSISPVLSQERRTLRVLFTIDDPDDVLRPGMFADIGLGTDAREALVVPLAGVVRTGHADLMLVRTSEDRWRIAPVQVGEVYDESVEVLDGLEPGDQVIGEGAILLKPVLVDAADPRAGFERGPQRRHRRHGDRPDGRGAR